MKGYLLASLAVLTMIAAPTWAGAQTRPQVRTPQILAFASNGDAGVSISTSGGVTFAASNPSLQPVTPATGSLIATMTIINPKNGSTWDLKIRSAGSSFTGTSGAPISISNVHWSA